MPLKHTFQTITATNFYSKEVLKMPETIYVIEVTDSEGTYQYEYTCQRHAEFQYENEESCTMYEYKDGKHYFIKAK